MEDPFEKCIKDYSSSVKAQDTMCEVVVKVSNFSCQTKIEYYTNCLYFKNYFWVKVYPDGINNDEKGYISIYFCGTDLYNTINIIKYFKIDCIISVLDIEGSKKFSRSFIYEFSSSVLGNRNVLPAFGLERYLSRKAVLGEPYEYLPDDVLTIHIDVKVLEHFIDVDYGFDVSDLFMLESAFKEETGSDGTIRYYLSLDSELAKVLYLASSYFKCMAATPMAENSSRYVHIPSEDFPYFMNIWLILKGSPFMIDKYNFDISQLYSIANKYDIPHVIAACRNILKTYISFENIADISELADQYNDVYLKEAIKNFKEINGENVETTVSKLNVQQENLKMEWCAKFLGMNLKNFHYSRVVNEQSITSIEEHKFSYYS